MINAYDESFRVRATDADNQDQATRDDLPNAQPTVGVACVTTIMTTYPTTAGAFYAVQPASVSGTETEGGSATFVNGNNKFLAFNLGASVPPQGTKVYVEWVPYRWVFRYG